MASTLQLRTISIGGTAVSNAGITLNLSSGGGTGGGIPGVGTTVDRAAAVFSGTGGSTLAPVVTYLVSSAGRVTQYPPGVTPGTTAETDAAYAPIAPIGTTAVYRVIHSMRPQSLPDWRETVAVNTNPGNPSIPDVVHSAGWNVAAGSAYSDATKPGVWTASECYWNPGGTYRVMEHHCIEGGWPSGSGVSARWWGASARRILTTEIFDAGGFGGFGVPVTVGMDTDALAVRSNCPSQASYGGEARNVGSDHFTVGIDVATGGAAIRLSNVNTANAHSLLVQAHQGGYTLIQSDKAMYLRAAAGNLNIGDRAVCEGSFTPASMTDAAAPSNCLYYSTTQSKLCYKNPGGTVNPLY